MAQAHDNDAHPPPMRCTGENGRCNNQARPGFHTCLLHKLPWEPDDDSAIPAPRPGGCIAVTKGGTRCRLAAERGFDTCGVHTRYWGRHSKEELARRCTKQVMEALLRRVRVLDRVPLDDVEVKELRQLLQILEGLRGTSELNDELRDLLDEETG